MTRQPPRTLAGDLQDLQDAVRALVAALVRDAALIAWAIALGLFLAVLLGSWFGLIPPA